MLRRDTTQRRIIRKVFEDLNRPVRPEDVLDHARKSLPGLGMATIYRTINWLMEEKWLSSVPLPGQVVAYEVAGKGHHHHFHCHSCQQTVDINGCPGDLSHLVPRGFKASRHEIVIYGTCKDCAAQ
jgi:Fur family ferric uptake transcriptional regulator